MAFIFQNHIDWDPNNPHHPHKEDLDPNNPAQREFFIKGTDINLIQDLFINNFVLSDSGIIIGLIGAEFTIDSDKHGAAGGILYGGVATGRELFLVNNSTDFAGASGMIWSAIELNNKDVTIYARDTQFNIIRMQSVNASTKMFDITLKDKLLLRLEVNGVDDGDFTLYRDHGTNKKGTFRSSSLNGSYAYTLPNATGTLLTSAIKRQGTATFVSSGTVAVTFTTFGDADYKIVLTPDADENVYYSSKIATGFTINSSNGLSTANVDWIAIHD